MVCFVVGIGDKKINESLTSKYLQSRRGRQKSTQIMTQSIMGIVIDVFMRDNGVCRRKWHKELGCRG